MSARWRSNNCCHQFLFPVKTITLNVRTLLRVLLRTEEWVETYNFFILIFLIFRSLDTYSIFKLTFSKPAFLHLWLILLSIVDLQGNSHWEFSMNPFFTLVCWQRIGEVAWLLCDTKYTIVDTVFRYRVKQILTFIVLFPVQWNSLSCNSVETGREIRSAGCGYIYFIFININFTDTMLQCNNFTV